MRIDQEFPTSAISWDRHNKDPLLSIAGPEVPFVPRTNLDRYGFSFILAGRAGLHRPRRSFCWWMHGWLWWEELMDTEDLIGPTSLPRDLSMIAGTTGEAQVLRRAGYRNVLAGGLPFVYVKPQGVQRNEHVLLAFLAHSAESERHDVSHAPYLDYLASLRNSFEAIYVSVFALDSSENLRSAIMRRGLRVLNGANPLDRNSMIRTRRALEYCGHVSANTMGSPIAYALAAGCRATLCSPIYRYDPDVLAKSIHGFTKDYVARMEHVHSETYLRAKFPELFADNPARGYHNPAVGSTFIGSGQELDPGEILAATGWTFDRQVNGYLSGAARRSFRHLRSILRYG